MLTAQATPPLYLGVTAPLKPGWCITTNPPTCNPSITLTPLPVPPISVETSGTPRCGTYPEDSSWSMQIVDDRGVVLGVIACRNGKVTLLRPEATR